MGPDHENETPTDIFVIVTVVELRSDALRQVRIH